MLSIKPTFLMTLVSSLLVLAFGLFQPLQGQDDLKPSVWLRSTDIPPASFQAGFPSLRPNASTVNSNPKNYIGNHPVFPDSSTVLLAGLKEVSKENTGSLFIVLRNDSIATGSPLLSVGATRVYKDSTLVRNHNFDNIQIDSSSILIRAQYQGSSLMKHLGQLVWIDRNTVISEVIFYDSYLSSSEARKVESYLALKYSINISRNKDKSLRDYLTMTGEKVWRYKADKEYSKSILGIGRVDDFDFYQLNTFSSDSRTIQFSIDDSLSLGMDREDSVDNNSLVILAEKEFSPLKSNCHTLFGERYWKLRFHNWGLNTPYLYLTVDTNYQSQLQYYVLDGITQYLASAKLKQDKAVIAIPVPHSMKNGVMYIVSTQVDSSCIPTLDYTVHSCNDTSGAAGAVHISIGLEELPVSVSLLHELNGKEYQYSVNEQWFVLENIPEGLYRMRIKGNNGFELDELLPLGTCTSDSLVEPRLVIDPFSNSLYTTSVDQKNSTRSIVQSDLSGAEIIIYPNPSMSHSCMLSTDLPGLDELDIAIIDAQGKIIDVRNLNLKLSNSIELHFPKSGIYTVRCTGKDFSTSRQVIIY